MSMIHDYEFELYLDGLIEDNIAEGEAKARAEETEKAKKKMRSVLEKEGRSSSEITEILEMYDAMVAEEEKEAKEARKKSKETKKIIAAALLSDNNQRLLCRFVDGIVEETQAKEEEYARERLRILLQRKGFPQDEIEEYVTEYGKIWI